jgi:zinc protease
MLNRIILSLGLLSISGYGNAVELVSHQTVDAQKRLTTTFQLKNGIPVIYRTIPDSDILQIKVMFSLGEKDLPQGKRSLLRWLMGTMPMAAKEFPKEKMNEEVTKYSLEMSCSASTETSSCDLGTVNDFFAESLSPFSAMINSPLLADQDLELQRERLGEATKQEKDNPSSYINHVVNRVFYRAGHPYRLTFEEIVGELAANKASDVRELQGKLLDSSLMTIVVVGSINKEVLTAGLEAAFGKISNHSYVNQIVKEPAFNSVDKLEFEDRVLPTAYMRAKITVPAATAPDATASNLMFEILSQRMFEEIRSKRSLSYTPFAASLYMSIGIGVIDISSPKPQESLKVLAEVIKSLKDKPLTADEVEEYKRLYATRYFLTQESHQAMGDGIAKYYHYFKSVDPLYEMPLKLSEVTNLQVQAMAKKYVKNLRVGILYERKKFQDDWIKVLP